jgi:curved DNA-binding protein CbpA
MTPANDLPAAARTAALALLELSEGASPAEILAAYRRLARMTHPDATGRTDPAASQDFAELHDAFELLTQPRRGAPHGEQRVGASAEPAGPAQAAAAEPPARPARPRPGPVRQRRVRTQRPIVAGPVIVTGLASSDRTHGVGDDH